jgi:Plavaka transposase
VDYHFTEVQNSESWIDQALDFWLTSTIRSGGDADDIPWRTAKSVYRTIDSIKEGSVPWMTTTFRYTGPLPSGNPPKWMVESYNLCLCNLHDILLNQIESPDLQGHFDYVPYIQFNENRDHVWSNLMSGAWAWQEAVRYSILDFSYTHVSCQEAIRCDIPLAKGAMLVPVIAGSNKTMVSVATGHQEFYPVYAGVGNLDNTM